MKALYSLFVIEWKFPFDFYINVKFFRVQLNSSFALESIPLLQNDKGGQCNRVGTNFVFIQNIKNTILKFGINCYS